MSKGKHWLWIAALIVALVGPAAWAEETSDSPSWLDQLVAQIVALIEEGSTAPPAALGDPDQPPELELGINIPVGG